MDWKQLENQAKTDAVEAWRKHSHDPEALAQDIQKVRERIANSKDFQYAPQAKEDAVHAFVHKLELVSHGQVEDENGHVTQKKGWKHQAGEVYVKETSKGEAKLGTVEDGVVFSGNMKNFRDLLPQTPVAETRQVRGTGQYNRTITGELIEDPEHAVKHDI